MSDNASPLPSGSGPSVIKWGLSIAASVGLTGMLCCVAPMLLFMLGIMGGTYAISFADFFYRDDGSAGTGAWALRFLALLLAGIGIWRYRAKESQCSIDPKKHQRNLVLLVVLVGVVGTGVFFTLESISSWYFDVYIVPAQQQELGL